MYRRFSWREALRTLSPPDYQTEVAARLKRLATVLQDTYHIELREDSQLAWWYATSSAPDHTLDDVAREVWYVSLLHRYTSYATLCQSILPPIQSALEQRRFTPAQARQHIQTFVLPWIQLNCFSSLWQQQYHASTPTQPSSA